MRFEAWNMSGDFRLQISFSGFLVSVCCVIFHQRFCVSTWYKLLEGCFGRTPTQPWIQIVDYLLLGLAWNIRLRIGTSHLSIFQIMVHGSCYIFQCFWFSVIFGGFLFVVVAVVVIIIIIIIIRKWVVGTNCLVTSYDNIKKFLKSEFKILDFFYVDRLE